MILLSALVSALLSAASAIDGRVRPAFSSLASFLDGSALGGAVELDVTTNTTPTAADLDASSVSLVGTKTANTTITIPALKPGAKIAITNNSGGHQYTLRLVDNASRVIYFAPNQTRTITANATGGIDCENPDEISGTFFVSLVGAVGTVDTPVCAVPAGTVLDRFALVNDTPKAGGTSTVSAGVLAPADLLAASTDPAAANGITGNAAADWGGLVDADSGQAQLIAAGGAITVRNVVSGSAVTAGGCVFNFHGRVITAATP